MPDALTTVRVAAVQAAPVFLDRERTVSRLDSLVAEAARGGAGLVAFGESFVPGFPLWCLVRRPIDQHHAFQRLRANAVDVPGPVTEALGNLAARHGVYLSIGVTERSPVSVGGLYNANLVFAPDGSLQGHHRKLIGTWAEKLVWANGDAAGLQCIDTGFGRLGVLICGENTNPLARYALMAQGELLHIATWPPAWPFRREESRDDYRRWIEIRTAAHSFEGKVFNVSVASVLDEAAIVDAADGDADAIEILRGAPPAMSLVTDPNGRPKGDPIIGEEGILYADCDMNDCVSAKMAHDVVCGYQRLDIFDVRMNTRRPQPLELVTHPTVSNISPI